MRAHRRELAAHGNPGHNFVEAERHPLIQIHKDLAACISLKFLERKFAAGIHHILLRGLKAADRRRYFGFFGRVFERYVHRVGTRTFDNRFVPGFKYGNPQREAADGWILYPGCAVVLEAKSARFSLDVRLSGDLGAFEGAFRRTILRGARQLHRAIDDFRAGHYAVGGFSAPQLPRLLPVVVLLDYVPLDFFLSHYIQEMVANEALLTQPNVGRLTVLAIKDLEHIAGATKAGVSFADLLEERLASNVAQHWPFSNFLVDRFKGGFEVNPESTARFKELLADSALTIFGSRLGR